MLFKTSVCLWERGFGKYKRKWSTTREVQRCHFLINGVCAKEVGLLQNHFLARQGMWKSFWHAAYFSTVVFHRIPGWPGRLQPLLGCKCCCSRLGWTVLSFQCSCFVLKMFELRIEPEEWTINRSAVELHTKFEFINKFRPFPWPLPVYLMVVSWYEDEAECSLGTLMTWKT